MTPLPWKDNLYAVGEGDCSFQAVHISMMKKAPGEQQSGSLLPASNSLLPLRQDSGDCRGKAWPPGDSSPVFLQVLHASFSSPLSHDQLGVSTPGKGLGLLCVGNSQCSTLSEHGVS